MAELAPGARLAHYRIDQTIGAGGMGLVLRAFDTRLNRIVALKVIAQSGGARSDQRERFMKEARAASAFTHPNVVTIHAVETADGIDFIVMELVDGRSLAERLSSGPLSLDDALVYGEQVASALDAAHAAGIVHRDIKPANIMVSESGRVKVLDFGIAKQMVAAPPPDALTASVAAATKFGVVMGSLPYMSPEQAQGKPVDGRSDVFSFGVVLYEMLSGRRPFGGTTEVETLAKILEAQPPALDTLREDIPTALTTLVGACLEKDRDRRPTARELHQKLSALVRSRAAAPGGVVRRRSIGIVAAVVFAVAGIGAAWWWVSGRDAREARTRLPAIKQLADRYDYDGFYRAARDVIRALPEDPQLKQTWINMTNPPVTIETNPAGADISIKGYSAVKADWIPLGQSPITDVRVPLGLVRVRALMEGYTPLEVILNPFVPAYTLEPIASTPEGMVRVTANAPALEGRTLPLPEFWMDRFEVTNQQFKAFVDAGGYRTEKYWREPFTENERSLTWPDAMMRFRDRTGRPGPATWELGTYPQGQADFPVSGVSWYEAAAYGEFVGKSLPTAYQWRGAGDLNGAFALFGDNLPLSNFGTKGPAAVGSYQGLGAYGTYDMAGNVKEWCSNASSNGRMIFGGGWNEPTYMYNDRDAQPPMKRLPEYGFRLVKNIAAQPPASYEFVQKRTRDYNTEKPVDDAAFAILRSLYRYDPSPLNAKVEDTQDAPAWRRETVTLDAAYDANERVIAYLYLPKAAAPPYQPVVYFPGGDATILRSSRDLRLTETEFVIRSGRALVYPVYKGTYERQARVRGPNAGRDLTIQRVKDFGRVLDYIESRPDLDATRIGYFGLSLGSSTGVINAALNPRVKSVVLMGGGFPGGPLPTETDLLNFAPRITAPTLMVNGASDFTFPSATSQLPLFRFLGPPPDRKRHAQLEGGHIPTHMYDVMREILDWFDKYLGPVTPVPGG